MPQKQPRPIRRALLSVFDKTGIVDFARTLHERKIELIATGGTADELTAAGLPVIEISELTGFPEIMDGRVKTLHPKIYGGLLAERDNRRHQADAKKHDILPIDLVVINLYPFAAMRAANSTKAQSMDMRAAMDVRAVIEAIDIGGPAMIRAAAKNHADVAVLVDKADYDVLLESLAAHKNTTGLELRQKLAQKAFAHTALYDALIADWLSETSGETMPEYRLFGGKRQQYLRYGENPHQQGGFYVPENARPGVATARQLQGKPLSYNNIYDSQAGFELVCEFDAAQYAACAIIKHATPCGVALGDNLPDAFHKALACDRKSAFGGIIAMNRFLDARTAQAIIENFTEVIIAPGVDEDAQHIIAKKKNLRLLITDELADPQADGLCVRSIGDGFLVQGRDNISIAPADMQTVSRRTPNEREMADLLFAFQLVKHVKSNAIVCAKDKATIAIGAGQTSRLDSVHLAIQKAQTAQAEQTGQKTGRTKSLQDATPLHTKPLQNCVVASDAFFPFADGLLAAAEAGATAIIQPGGSIRDDEVIAAADKADIAMVFTHIRHFRH